MMAAKGSTTVIRMTDLIEHDRKLSRAVGQLAELLGTKTSALVALAVLKEYGAVLKHLGLFDTDSVASVRQADQQ